MPSFKIFDIAGSAMAAQTVRLNLVASNMSNSESVSSSINQVYKSRQPVFAAEFQTALEARRNGQGAAGVKLAAVVESKAPPRIEYAPEHPLADAKGYIYRPNVNTIEELTNMVAASRSYQDNVEVANTAKDLLLQTIRMGQ